MKEKDNELENGISKTKFPLTFTVALFVAVVIARKQLNVTKPFSKWRQIFNNIIIGYITATMSFKLLFILLIIFHYFHKRISIRKYKFEVIY